MVSSMTSVEQVKIPEGYKQTEVGVIPEDWEISSGEEITNLIGKGASPRWQGFSYTDSGMLFVTSENVRDGFLDVRNPKYLPLEFHEKLQRSKLHKGDILINLVGASIGRSCQIKQELGEANINQAVAIFRVKDEFNSKFIACYFQSDICIDRIFGMQVDAARPNVSLGDLRGFLLPLPLPKEQTAIANALSDVDNLIASLETLIAKKSAIKTAAMQQLLTGKKRLPGFGPHSETHSDNQRTIPSSKQPADSAAALTASPAKDAQTTAAQTQAAAVTNKAVSQAVPRPGYKKTELGEIPEDWEVVGLGCLFEDKLIRKRISGQDEVTFIGMQDVSESAKISSFHKVKYADVKSGFTYFERFDVLVAKITPCFENGKGAYTDILDTDIGFGSTEFHVLRATKNTDSKYLYYFTNTEKFRKELEGEMVGSAGHRRVPLTSIQNYQVAISKNKKEQTAIANVLSDMDTELDALQQRLAKTQKIKQGMMQELLTGKTRLV